MNIVSMAMQYLTPMLIDRIASSLGVQSPMVKAAIAAILPTILAGITGVAARPDGGRKITDVLGRQNPNILGDLGSIFGGPKQAEAAKSGSDVLGDLLGGSAVNGLTGAAAKFSGLGSTATQSLVGMLAPVALGTLAQQTKSQGLDPAGLVNMLLGQKDNIKAALPAGFADQLKGTGLLDSVMPAAGVEPPRSVPATHAPQKSGMGMLPLIAGALALAVLGWYYLGNQRPSGVTIPTAPAITVGSTNIGAQLGSAADDLRRALGDIKDEASARNQLARLQGISTQLNGVKDAAARLPADGKKSLAAYAAQLLPIIRPLIDNALAGTGVGPIAKPVLDQIFNRLTELSRA